MSGTTTSPSVTINDGTSWAADGPLKDIISAFNGGSPINIVTGVKSVLADGFTIVGTANFLGNAQATVTITVKTNGDITLLAELAEAQLSHLLGAAPQFSMISGFEVPMPATSILIQRTGSDASLSAAAVVANIGEVVFVASHDTGWQVAAGLQLNVANLADLPGLKGSKLAAFDNFIGLSDLMMVVSSHDDADFDFPEISSFQAPALGSAKISLPKTANGKLVEGLNVYAGLSTTKGGGFQAIAKFLHLELDGTIGVTLAVSLPDPETNTKLFLTFQEEIKRGITLNGELGVLMSSGAVGVFLTGELVAPIQGQPAQFDVTALVVESGVLFSGSMINTAPIHFDIGSVRLRLADVGLVIGIDDDGIPSLGFCATIDVDRFNAAIAVFIDSVTPANSMFAAAVSGITLRDVVEVLADQHNLPGPLAETLDAFGLKPLGAFTLPASIGHALDNRDLPSVAVAFAQHGVTIASNSDGVLLDVNTPGQLWYLTDLKVMNHYILKLANGAIRVSLEPQLYVAPQATAIGALNFAQGYKIIGEIDLLVARAAIDIEIQGKTGIVADIFIGPITVINPNFLAITGAGGQGGPFVSLATYARPQEPNPLFRQPHFAMSGEIRLLGAEVANVSMNFSRSGVVFDVQGYVTPIIQIDLHANIESLQKLSFGGSIVIGINNTFNLGPLGSVHIALDAHGSLNVGVANGSAFANFQAGLQFESWNLQTPRLSLDISSGALLHVADLLVAELKQLLLNGLLQDVQRFMGWVRNGVLTGLHTVEQIAGVLKNEFRLAAGDAAKLLHDFGHDVGQIAGALKNVFGLAAHDVANVFKSVLHLPSDVVNSALKAAGYAAHDIENALSSAYDWAKSHLNPSHW